MKHGSSPRARLAALDRLPVDDGWMTKGVMLASFEFGQDYFDDLEDIRVNRLGSMVAYQYHQGDWQKEQGIFRP